jgi:hypothetical protein
LAVLAPNTTDSGLLLLLLLLLLLRLLWRRLFTMLPA